MNNKYLVYSLIFLFCFIYIPQTSKSQDSITLKVDTSVVQQQTCVIVKEKHQKQIHNEQNGLKQKLQVAAISTKTVIKPISNSIKKLKVEKDKEPIDTNITTESLYALLRSVNQPLTAKIDSSEHQLIKYLQAKFESQKQTNENTFLWKVLFTVGLLISFVFSLCIIKLLNKLNFPIDTSKNIIAVIEDVSSRLKGIEFQLIELQASIIKFEKNVNISTKMVETLTKQINLIQKSQVLPNDISEMKQELCDKDKLSLTPQNIVAYNDAIQAFVNINNYIFDLRQHNTLIMPLITCLAQGDRQQKNLLSLIDLKTQPEQDRIKISLLVSKIEQFLMNNKPAIEHYLSLSQNTSGLLYKDCIRCPIGETFDTDQDRNILGDNMLEGQKIKCVFKLGFYFPGSKGYPYREKSLVI